ncbi:MAG: lycopene cyclase domain-containing protein [Brachybacterium sp.]|nr:lycopene cyclase domain-containing protein [Brachybacterium sp.]
MTYLLVNTVVLVIAGLLTAALLRRLTGAVRRRVLLLMGIAFLVVSVFTAVFDTLMIAVGLFQYDPAHLIGLSIGLAPIEDFAYVALACLLLPGLWFAGPGRRARPVTAKEAR